MFGKKKEKVVYEFTLAERQEVQEQMNHLKELSQKVIGARAIFQATLSGIATKAGVTDPARIQADLDRFRLIELPVRQEPRSSESVK